MSTDDLAQFTILPKNYVWLQQNEYLIKKGLQQKTNQSEIVIKVLYFNHILI